MDKQAFFWRIMAGELPPPQAAQTLGLVFKHIDGDCAGSPACGLTRCL